MALGQADIHWVAMGLQANLVCTIGIAQVIFIHCRPCRRTGMLPIRAKLRIVPSFRQGLPESRGHGWQGLQAHPCDLDVGNPSARFLVGFKDSGSIKTFGTRLQPLSRVESKLDLLGAGIVLDRLRLGNIDICACNRLKT
jgi:hypothetical protein